MTAPDRVYYIAYGDFRETPSDRADDVEYVRRDPAVLAALPEVKAQIDAAVLRKALHDLITEQSEGEWDDKTINKDVEVFLTAILALIRKGDQT